MIKGTLLEELFSSRINHALEVSLTMNEDYQKTVKKENTQYNRLEKMKLSNKQRMKVDRVISANNACGAAYGSVAYRQGFQDAVKLLTELQSI